MITFLAFAVLVQIIVPKKQKETATPGSLIVQLRWDLARKADIDLYLRDPDGILVWFNHKVDGGSALLRDDQGPVVTPGSNNSELSTIYGLKPGEYVITAEFYSAHEDVVLPVSYGVTATLMGHDGPSTIVDVTDTLHTVGEESTVARFKLDDKGQLVDGSMNRAPIYLAHSNGQTQ
jgi:hypothetical protein